MSEERQSLRHERWASFKHNYYHDREETPLEAAVGQAWEDAETFVSKVPDHELSLETLTFLPALQGAYFCGHLMADLDSISGAIGAAHLYGGVAARASEINSETKWALEEWQAACPEPIEDLLSSNPANNICLVDFQQQSQLNSNIPMSNIVGIIDHHALQSNTIITEKPIFIDIRPWGSMSSILAHSYAIQEKHLPKHIAGMLLSAILSDTLNLKSPTTTKWDERMVSMLVQYLDVPDVNELAARQFRAKSRELALLSPYQLVNGDMKKFKFNSASSDKEQQQQQEGNESVIYSVGFGVIETTDAAASLTRMPDILPEIETVRTELNLTCMLLAVVDIVNLTSSLLIAGPVEASLALEAYGGTLSQGGTILELPGLVSRKKDFVPPLTRAFANGWAPPVVKAPVRSPKGRRSSIVMDFSKMEIGQLQRIFLDADDTVPEEDELEEAKE